MTDYVGQQFGDYRLIRLIGRGGFADVYLGEHIRRKTLAAVKVLHNRLANDNVKSFLNEARSFRLRHPHIIEILDFGLENDFPFLVMDYAPNDSLRQLYPKGVQLPLPTIVSYVHQIADALQYAHDEGIVHRDIKPDNLLLGKQNDILLTDFGIASIAHTTQSLNVEEQAGTIYYMAPEQLQGRPRPASDQYALGVIVYEWLSGNRPFHGTYPEIHSQHLAVPPPSLREKIPAFSPVVEEVVMTALAKDPRQRFGSVRAFANALEQASKPEATRRNAPIDPKEPVSRIPASTIQSAHATKPPTAASPTIILPELASVANVQVGSDAVVSQISNRATLENVPVREDVRSKMVALPDTVGNPEGNSIGVHPTRLLPENAEPVQVAGGTPVPMPQPQAPPSNVIAKPKDKKPITTTHPKNKRLFLVAATLMIIVVMLMASIVFAASGGLTRFSNVIPGSTVTAKATITPVSKDEKDSFVLTAVTGKPDSTQRQVQTRILTATSAMQSSTAQSTGSIPGAKASGTLRFLNLSTSSIGISGGILTGTDGVEVSYGAVTIPTSGISITGTAVNVGARGNIAAFDINGFCCGNKNIFVKNLAFSGGRDPQPNSVVQQSDITSATTALQNALTPGTKTALQKQMHANEQTVNSVTCTPTVSANHKAGDQAKTVTVTGTITCTQEVYDQQGTRTLAANLLKTEAQKNLDSTYALLNNNVVTHISTASIIDAHGTVSLDVTAEGIWVYQFSNAVKQNLAQLIAGQSQSDARDFILQQRGVRDVQIAISSGTTLPTDAADITIVINSVSGLPGTGFPSPTAPAPIGTPASPTATPSTEPGLGGAGGS